jgi:hypothetical protein
VSGGNGNVERPGSDPTRAAVGVEIRAPRLTEGRLADLEVAVLALDEEVAYLAGTLGTYPKGSKLQARFAERHASLVRARDWISGKVAAERAQRGAGGEAAAGG